MAQEPRDLKAADIGDYLDGRDDFDLELFALRALRSRGWITDHGGTYIDPLTGKRRQYDIRARQHFEANCYVSLAVECKSLSHEFPLVISSVPRLEQDASHDILRVADGVDSRLREVSIISSEPHRFCLYGPSQMVGKSLTRIGWEQSGKKLISSDGELYDKWAQALASAAELVTIAAEQTIQNGVSYTFVMPVLLVNDESLWTVDYAEDGTRAEARRVDDAYYFADAEQRLPDVHYKKPYRMSHLHIYTRTGFRNMLGDYASLGGTMWERTFVAAVRAG